MYLINIDIEIIGVSAKFYQKGNKLISQMKIKGKKLHMFWVLAMHENVNLDQRYANFCESPASK